MATTQGSRTVTGTGPGDPGTPDELVDAYRRTRSFTERICETLVPEDHVIQSMPDVSPTKWHLAHTTWFFETFVLGAHDPGYQPLNPRYSYLFNSYYNAVGEQFCRPRRGQISRPTVEEVHDYRRHVDERMNGLLERLASDDAVDSIRDVVTLGINHEQQHQELMVTDIKHVFSMNPLFPVFRERPPDPAPRGVPPVEWLRHEGGVYEIGYAGGGFHFDNERPVHRVYLEPFEIASRLVTNGEFLQFMEEGGYRRPDLWLSLGWSAVRERDWSHPLYWTRTDGGWVTYTLAACGRRTRMSRWCT